MAKGLSFWRNGLSGYSKRCDGISRERIKTGLVPDTPDSGKETSDRCGLKSYG